MKRRKTTTPAATLSNFRALNKTLFLCTSCQAKLPWRWAKRWEYVKLPDFHGVGFCDGWCQAYGPADLFLPESGGYFQEYLQHAEIRRQGGSPFLVHDHRRVR